MNNSFQPHVVVSGIVILLSVVVLVLSFEERWVLIDCYENFGRAMSVAFFGGFCLNKLASILTVRCRNVFEHEIVRQIVFYTPRVAIAYYALRVIYVTVLPFIFILLEWIDTEKSAEPIRFGIFFCFF